MSRIRALSGHLAYGLLGAAVGIGSAVLWLHVLTPHLTLWAVGPIAACFALLVIGALAAIQWRRTAARPRRAHARLNPKTRRKPA